MADQGGNEKPTRPREELMRIWELERLEWFETHLAMFRGQMDFAILALKSIILVNGAAAVALLAFLAQIWGEKSATAVAAAAGSSLGGFVIGTACGVAAAAFSYFAQALYLEHSQRWGAVARWVAIGLGAAGMVAFALGAWNAIDAYTGG